MSCCNIPISPFACHSFINLQPDIFAVLNMKKIMLLFVFGIMLFAFGCIEYLQPRYVCPDGTTVMSPSFCNSAQKYVCTDGTVVSDSKSCPSTKTTDKYVCANGSVVYDKTQCGSTTPPVSNTTVNLTKPNCNSTPVLTAITSNLLTKSNACRSTRITVLCSKCPTCCSGGVEKTEYQQSIDSQCYSCAYTNYGVARARDYYDKMGVYSGKCVENCADLVTAYKAFLQYCEDYKCELPTGWKICNDVTLS